MLELSGKKEKKEWGVEGEGVTVKFWC